MFSSRMPLHQTAEQAARWARTSAAAPGRTHFRAEPAGLHSVHVNKHSNDIVCHIQGLCEGLMKPGPRNNLLRTWEPKNMGALIATRLQGRYVVSCVTSQIAALGAEHLARSKEHHLRTWCLRPTADTANQTQKSCRRRPHLQQSSAEGSLECK